MVLARQGLTLEESLKLPEQDPAFENEGKDTPESGAEREP